MVRHRGKANKNKRGVLIWMWLALSAPKARRILAQRNALGLKEPQHARPEWARGVLPPRQGGTLFDSSFPARCAGLIPFGASSAEDKLGHYSAEGSRAACGAQAKPLA